MFKTLDVLDAETEKQLIADYKACKAGNHAADTLIRANARLVISIANKFKNRGIEEDDLIQEGLKALAYALDKFDPDKNVKFATYATYWVRQSIIRCVKGQSRAVRLPEHIVNYGWAITKYKREFVNQYNRDPTLDEIAANFKQSAKFIKRIQKAMIAEASLNAAANDDGKAEVADLLPASNSDHQVDDVERKELKVRLWHIIHSLPESEQLMLNLRYGIGYDKKIEKSFSKK